MGQCGLCCHLRTRENHLSPDQAELASASEKSWMRRYPREEAKSGKAWRVQDICRFRAEASLLDKFNLAT